MHSLLQYRRLGVAAKAQLDRDAESSSSSSAGGHNNQHQQNETTGENLYPVLTGITPSPSNVRGILIVGWSGPQDKENPHNWPIPLRIAVTLQVALIGLFLTGASAIDATVLPQYARDLGVSETAGSLATGLYLVGMGLGSLVAGPFSETFGRNAVYAVSLVVFVLWIMAAGLAPNFGSHIVFRLLAGCCASTPLVCAGGSIADMFDSLEKTWAFPLYALLSFVGPMLGAVMGAWIGPSELVSWRWTEWTMMIASGSVLVVVLLLMPETYGPLILQWKAAHYRRVTGDSRFRCEHEMADATLLSRLRVSMTRPFLMFTEPIIMAMTLYITVVYIVLFTFLVGWPYIFEYTFAGINQGLSNTIFVAMAVGTLANFFMVPIVYRATISHNARAKGQKHTPEIRLWYAMFGAALSIPISLFWLGWTDFPSISPWSAIMAVFLFGYGVAGIFLTVYMYIIDSYEIYSASALTFVSLVRYVVAGGMTVAGIPWYEAMGTHYTLTILACISVALAPIPYLLYYYGHLLRAKSKYAVI